MEVCSEVVGKQERENKYNTSCYLLIRYSKRLSVSQIARECSHPIWVTVQGYVEDVSFVELDDQTIPGALKEGKHRLLRAAREDAAEYLTAYYENPRDRALALKALEEIFIGRRPSFHRRNLEVWGNARAERVRAVFAFAWYQARQAIGDLIKLEAPRKAKGVRT
jgi:hypothetical protein